MKDIHGNGLTIEECETLTDLAVRVDKKVIQRNNTVVVYNRTWDFKSPYNRDNDATIAEQKRVIDAWQTITKPQGIHLNIPKATITFGMAMSVDAYAAMIMPELQGDDEE